MVSNDQTEQEHKLNKVNPGSGPTIEEEAEQAKARAEARAVAAEQAKLEINARLRILKQKEVDVFALIKSAAVAELARLEEARVAAEEQAKLYKALYDRLAVMEHKLDQVPITSTVVQEQGNAIDSGIDEDKSLREKIRGLSDRLDSHDRVNKFICSAFDPAELQGQAKEMYGLICPKVGHDEL